MAEWALSQEWPVQAFGYYPPCQYQPFEEMPCQQLSYESQAQPTQQTPNYQAPCPPSMQPVQYCAPYPQRDNPREIRNKAEKQRRDKLNETIADLSHIVPPVVTACRKIDKIGILRLTAHFLRSHQYVFGDSIDTGMPEITPASAMAVLQLLNGFLLTITYKGIVVAVSPNIQQYLGYSELELLGFNISTITHEDDHNMLLDQLRPRSQALGDHGELVIPDQPDGNLIAAKMLAAEKRQFFIRFKKNTQRSEPTQYVTCHVEGSLRKSDRASRDSQCCQIVHRARARIANPYSSGNDVVFIGVVRPTSETFKKESQLEQFRMEYRTRHSIDGQIIQCEKRIALVTGYMTDEVHGVNAMNFMHRDDVRWVIIALREKTRQAGSSIPRLEDIQISDELRRFQLVLGSAEYWSLLFTSRSQSQPSYKE